MLRLGRSRIEVSIATLMMIDSLEMTAAGRGRIVDECGRAPRRGSSSPRHRHHGGDPPRRWRRHCAGERQDIVLTGR